jgi:general secretion pathway protein B
MSFILDALKKSELERQRQSMPALVDAGHGGMRRRLPLWALVLCLLLILNLAVLAVVASRGGLSLHTAPAPAPAPVPAPAPSAAAVRAADPPPSPAAESRSPTALIASRAPGGEAARNAATAATADTSMGVGGRANAAPAAGEAPATPFSPMDGSAEYAPEIPLVEQQKPTPAAASRTARRPTPVARHDEPPEEVLPTIGEIDITGPPLHLDVHVWATRPADRFVYINMRKYREGQTLVEGPTVERIRHDGVVLAYQGVRFLVPRQQ